jgi:hypothetical protein
MEYVTSCAGRNYPPVVLDFEKPSNESTMETVSLLGNMVRLAIAFLTDALSGAPGVAGTRPEPPVIACPADSTFGTGGARDVRNPAAPVFEASPNGH